MAKEVQSPISPLWELFAFIYLRVGATLTVIYQSYSHFIAFLYHYSWLYIYIYTPLYPHEHALIPIAILLYNLVINYELFGGYYVYCSSLLGVLLTGDRMKIYKASMPAACRSPSSARQRVHPHLAATGEDRSSPCLISRG